MPIGSGPGGGPPSEDTVDSAAVGNNRNRIAPPNFKVVPFKPVGASVPTSLNYVIVDTISPDPFIKSYRVKVVRLEVTTISEVNKQDEWLRIWRISQKDAEAPASQDGGTIYIDRPRWLGVDCFFMACSVGRSDFEGSPTRPYPNPTGPTTGLLIGGGNSIIPNVVTNQAAFKAVRNINGVDCREITYAAQIPPSPSFSGFQAYIKGYKGNPAVVESLFVPKSGVASDQYISGTYIMETNANVVTIYFVSVAKDGGRRTDPTSAPSTTLNFS